MEGIVRSNSEMLRAKISLAMPRMREQLSKFWEHPEFEQLFPRHLKRAYFVTSASIPVMENALERADRLAPGCSVAAALVPYLEKHIVDETGHADWILEDLETLGVDRSAVLSMTPPTDVATLVGSQYYYVNHAHPVAVVAYQAVIEGNPPRAEFLDSVVANTSIQRQSLSSFYQHAEIDRHHSVELWGFLDGLELEPRHAELLGINAFCTMELLAELMEKLLASFAAE